MRRAWTATRRCGRSGGGGRRRCRRPSQNPSASRSRAVPPPGQPGHSYRAAAPREVVERTRAVAAA